MIPAPVATVNVGGANIDPAGLKPATRRVAAVNRVPNPRAASVLGYTATYGTGGAGSLSWANDTGTPASAGLGYVRATWSTASTAAGSGQLRADGRLTAAAPAPIPVYPGEVLSASCEARPSLAQRLGLVVAWFAADGSQIGISPTSATGTAVVAPANLWTALKVEGVTVPTGAAYCLVGPQALSGSGAVVWPVGATLDQRKTYLGPGATAPAYFDGDTAAGALSYRWNGERAASVSMGEQVTAGARSGLTPSRLSIKWGRTSLLARPTPATASLVLIDTDPGFPFASRPDLLGSPVVLGYTSADLGTVTNFRGRVTDVDVSPIRIGGRRGMRVELSASSREVDAAQYLTPKGTTFPAEDFATRLARILSYLPAGYFPGGVTMPTRADVNTSGSVATEYALMPAAALDVSGQDVLSMLRVLWDSIYPAPLVYDPRTDGFTFATRRVLSGGTAALAATSSGFLPAPKPAGSGLSVSNARLEYSGVAAAGIDQRLTRVEVQYRDAANGNAQATTVAGTSDAGLEETVGRRSLSVDTLHNNGGYAANLATAWASVADLEGRTRRIGDVTYSTKRAGGFDNYVLGLLLLAGRETSDAVFVRGSWLPAVAARPLFGVLGGTLTYTDGEWSVQFTPAPVAPADTAHALRIAEAPAGLKLADFDPSATFGDLRYVDTAVTI